MDINIQFMHCNPNEKVEQYAVKKIEKLSTFYDEILKAQVRLKIGNQPEHENKIVEIRLEIPGNDIFAEEHCHSFECAIDLAVDTLKIVLKKTRDKQRSH